MLLNHKGYYNVATNAVKDTGLPLADGTGTLNDTYTIYISPNPDNTYLFDRDLGSGLSTWVSLALIIYDGAKWYCSATVTPGGGGSGSVTSVAVDSTLQSTPNPITVTGVIGMPAVVTPGSFTNANITIDAQGRVTTAASSAGAAIAIGSPITGGTANYILYVDAASKLAQDINFQWLSATKTLQFGAGCQIYYDTQLIFLDVSTGDSVLFLSPSVTFLGSNSFNAVLYIDKSAGITGIGDVFFNNNGTQIYIDDVAQSVLVRGNPQLVNYTINGGLLYTDGSGNMLQRVAGTVINGYVAKTGTYTITTSDYTIDCTSGTFTVTLPTAAGITGQVFVIKNSGVGVITVATTGGQTIDGLATQTVTAGNSITVQGTGSSWIII